MDKTNLPPLPEQDESRSNREQGLYRKFDVFRTDGSDGPGGKHHGCEYFVLDVNHDPAAKAALAAYADAIEGTHPDLARDMRERYAARAVREAVPGWQPIETAPKDGTFVLLSGVDLPVWQGSWVEKSGRYAINGWTRFNSIDTAWRPTHWQPLPAAPTQDQENGS